MQSPPPAPVGRIFFGMLLGVEQHFPIHGGELHMVYTQIPEGFQVLSEDLCIVTPEIIGRHRLIEELIPRDQGIHLGYRLEDRRRTRR